MNNTYEHSLQKSALFHLLPGILTGIVYYALASVVWSQGFPTVMALILALIPFELGFLLYQKKKTGKPFFNGIIRFCDPIPARAYLLWVPAIFLSSGLLFTLFNFSADLLMPLFSWIPEHLYLDMGLDGGFSKENLRVTSVLFFVFVVVILPVTEELYFRGWFAVTHAGKPERVEPCSPQCPIRPLPCVAPWMLITRPVAVLPLIYGVQKKEMFCLGLCPTVC